MSRKSLQVESHAFGAAELKTRAVMSADQLGFGAPAKPTRTRRVGFIGLDRTGEAMASRLLKAGHQLTVYDPTRNIDAAPSACWTVANSIQDACRSADAVFTMLPNEEAAEAVILGPRGIVESLAPSAIHIGSSTVSIECSDRIVEAHWDAGKQYVSAPVLVGSEPTVEQRLFLIAGGREATIVQIAPLLSRIGQMTQLSGWPSDANLVQLGAVGSTLFQFLARHPELCASQDWSQLARPAFPHIETKGVLQ